MGVGEEEGILVLLALVHSPLAGLGHLMPMKQESQGGFWIPRPEEGEAGWHTGIYHALPGNELGQDCSSP